MVVLYIYIYVYCFEVNVVSQMLSLVHQYAYKIERSKWNECAYLFELKWCECSRHNFFFIWDSKQQRVRVFCESNWLKDKIIIKIHKNIYFQMSVRREKKKIYDTSMNCLGSNYAVHMTRTITLNNRRFGITKIRDISHKSLFSIWYANLLACRYFNGCHFPITHSKNGILFDSATQYTSDTFYLKIHARECSTWKGSRVKPTDNNQSDNKKKKNKTSSGTFFSLCPIKLSTFFMEEHLTFYQYIGNNRLIYKFVIIG